MDKAQENCLQAKIKAIKPWTSPLWHQRYSFFSAHLGLAFPHVAPAQHIEWFHRVLLNQQLMLREEEGSGLDEIQWEGPLDELMSLLNAQPSIICTFHTGSYRLLNHFLLKNCNLPLSLLVSKKVDESERPNFHQKIQEMDLPAEMNLRTIVADQPHSALHIMRSLASGRHLLAYLDGNLGSNHSQAKRDTRMELCFMGLPIRIRYGLAYVAYRAGVPLICIIAHRTSDLVNHFKITRINPPPDLLHSEPLNFAGEVMQKMYGDLEDLLVNEPWQWDMWFHFREYLL